MANFPTSVSTNANLYIAVNGLQTTLAVAVNNSITTLTLTSTTGFPTTGLVTVDNTEIVSYTGISGADLTGCTRGADGTTAASHPIGVTVGLTVVAAHHNLLKDEVIAVETALGAGYVQASANTANAVVQRDGSGNFAAGTITASLTGSASNNVLKAGDTMTGDLTMDNDKAVIFKETTANGTDSITVKAPASVTTSYTVQLPPAVGGAGTVLTDAAGNGVLSWSAAGTGTVTSVSGTTNQITSTGGATPVLALANPLTTPGPVTVTGSVTFTPTTAGIVGTTTSDDAASGNVGQNITSGLARSGSSLTTATALNVVSISVPAGDWEIRAMAGIQPSGTTVVTQVEVGISLTSATQPAASTRANPTAGGEVQFIGSYPAGTVPGNDNIYSIPSVRISRATTATYYLVVTANFSASTLSAYGFIAARRVR